MEVLADQLDYPFGFDPRGRSQLTGKSDHVRDLIEQVLFTAPDERVNRPEFGTPIKDLVFEGLSDTLVATTEQMVHGALNPKGAARSLADSAWFANREDGLYRWQTTPEAAERVYATGVAEGVPFLTTDIVAAVKRQHPEVPLIAVMRTIGELVASGVLWPIGGFERTNREMKIDPTTNQGGRKR